MIYIDTKHIAAHLRDLLKKKFPGIKFSVRTGTGTGSSWISVRWTDGPHTRQVDEIAQPLHGAHWDGYKEQYVQTGNELTVTVKGEKLTGKPLVDGISTHRSISEAALDEARALWVEHHGGADPEKSGMQDWMSVRGVEIRQGWPANQIRQIAEDVILTSD